MPVMATDIEAQRRVFKNEKFVFWCKENMESMAKTMENVIENKNKLSQLSKLAREYSLNWSWESSGKKLNEAFKKAV
jgi:glycosyltransferase involved in cell wall biosynthesis